jgi:uncharacterized membrane protein YbaN (DUF454 family)
VTPSVDQPVASRKPRSRVVRGIYLILGFICLGFVAISFLPGIPTFDFVILAAFFFSMSSDKLHDWMVNHPVYGKMIKGYRSGGLTVRMKWIAAIAITISLAFSVVLLVDGYVLRLILGAVWLFALWFVFSRPTRTLPASTSPAADGL